MEHTHTKTGSLPKAPEQQDQGMGEMLSANAMGASPLDASSPPVQRRPATADTPTASSGPNPGLTKGPGGGGEAEAPAAPKARAHSDKKLWVTSIDVPDMPKAIVAKLAGKEGIRQDVYLDSELLPTVGLGHCFSEAERAVVKVGDVYSVAEIEAFAANDLPGAWAATERQCTQLGVTDIDFMEALFHVNFQVGIAWNTEHKKTWSLMLAGDWEAAALEVADSKWNTQTPDRVANFQAALRKLSPGAAAQKGDGDWKAFKKEQAGSKPATAAKPTAPAAMPQDPAMILTAQTKLKAMGLYLAKPDGIGGTKTKGAVKAFQAKAGLKPSGEIDAATWAALIGEDRSFMKGSGDGPAAAKPKEKKQAVPKDKTPKGVAAFARAQADMLQHEQALAVPEEGMELDVKEYWESQKKTGNCDLFAKKVIDGHQKDNPGAYADFGGINAEKTKRENSLHTAWESDHEEGTKRTEGKKNANLHSTLERDDAEWTLALRYIVACLRAGVPAMVGVNHTYAYGNAAANNDKTTDHWLTIIGMGQDQKGRYFSYLDPGRKYSADGTNTKANRLYETADPHFWRDNDKSGDADAGTGSYTLVAVTLYSSHRGKSEFKVGTEVFKRKL